MIEAIVLAILGLMMIGFVALAAILIIVYWPSSQGGL